MHSSIPLPVRVGALLLLASLLPAEDSVYDGTGRLVRVEYDNGLTIEYRYDAGGNILAAGEPSDRPVFHRGDANGDGALDVADGIFLFNFLFSGGRAPRCREAADANNDASVDLSDGIFALNFLFLGSAPPPPPGPPAEPCGEDPDEEGTAGDLGCEVYERCKED